MDGRSLGRLAGHRLLVTRAPAKAHRLVRLIEAEGGEAVIRPAIAYGPPSDIEAKRLEGFLARLSDFDVLVAGSVEALRSLPGPGRRFSGALLLPGSKSQRQIAQDPALSAFFQGPLLHPALFRAEAMVERLQSYAAKQSRPLKLLVLRAPEGRDYLVGALQAAGFELAVVESYRILCAPADQAPLTQVSAALFLSGKTLACFVAHQPGAREFLTATPLAVIGPIAAAKAKDLGLEVAICPKEASAEALVEATASFLAGF